MGPRSPHGAQPPNELHGMRSHPRSFPFGLAPRLGKAAGPSSSHPAGSAPHPQPGPAAFPTADRHLQPVPRDRRLRLPSGPAPPPGRPVVPAKHGSPARNRVPDPGRAPPSSAGTCRLAARRPCAAPASCPAPRKSARRGAGQAPPRPSAIGRRCCHSAAEPAPPPCCVITAERWRRPHPPSGKQRSRPPLFFKMSFIRIYSFTV